MIANDEDPHSSHNPYGNVAKYVTMIVTFESSLMVLERRYATFKLYYTDDTPEDYEPQHFRPGDSEKDKFFFTTHDAQEIPEKFSVGMLETGLHGFVLDKFLFAFV